MFILNKNKVSLVNILNYLIALIPLSLILGNLAVNFNLILIIVLGFLVFGNKVFLINEKKYQFLIYAFFLYLILISTYRYFNNYNVYFTEAYFKNLIKSILYLRFLLLFLIISNLCEKNLLNFKIIFYVFGILGIILSIDILIQTIFKQNIIGYPIYNSKPSSFFGSESVAGPFLQKFCLFSIFFLIFNKKIKFLTDHKHIFFLFILFLIPIILTQNRIAIVLYVLSCVIYYLFKKEIIKIFALLIFFLGIIFLTIKFPVIDRLSTQIKLFYSNSLNIIINAPELFYYNKVKGKDFIDIEIHHLYLIHLNSGVQVWKKSKLFGGGLKSFRVNCKYGDNQTCNTHPHNYFIEIMVDTGLIGLFIIYSLFFLGSLNFVKIFLKNKDKDEENINFKLIFFLIVFIEFFPIKTSGSFFTTSNSILIYFFLAIFLNLASIKLKKNFLNQ